VISKFITGIFVGEKLDLESKMSPDQLVGLIAGKNEGSFVERMFVPGIAVRTSGFKFRMSKMSIGNLPMSGNGFTHILVGQIYPTAQGRES
jgi:hypothetical protein